MSDIQLGLRGATAANAENLFRAWQSGVARALRAQERMLQGITAAAALEWRYSQEYACRRLGMLNWDAEQQTSPQTPLHEVEKILTLSREVAQELTGCFTEAAKLLSETVQEEADEMEEVEESPAQAAHRPPPQAPKPRTARH